MSGAYLQVGAPPEVSARLTAMAQELAERQRTALGGLGTATEPELDQFMVSEILANTTASLLKKNTHFLIRSHTHGDLLVFAGGIP